MSKVFLKALTFGRLRHKKLPEEWGESIKQPVNEGMCFYVKYLGSCPVDKPSSESVTADAIKKIIQMAKSKGNKKLPRVSLCIKPSGITTNDVSSGEQMLDVSIYRISYCSADSTFERVVAFIATNKNGTMECHAFLTNKKKVSQAAALTISQAFTIAFENWQDSKNGKENSGTNSENPNPGAQKDTQMQAPQQQQQPLTSTPMKPKNQKAGSSSKPANESQVNLLDLSYEEFSRSRNNQSFVPFDSDLDDSFSKLAKSRVTGQANQEKQIPQIGSPDNHLLPSNIQSFNLKFDEEMRQCFDESQKRDDKFFDEKDDLLFL